MLRSNLVFKSLIVGAILLNALCLPALALAQDVPSEPVPGFNVWDWIDRADVVIAVTVVLAAVGIVLRPVLVKAVDHLASSIPAGYAAEVLKSVTAASNEALQNYIDARQAEAELTETTLDDEAWASLEKLLQELNEKISKMGSSDEARG